MFTWICPKCGREVPPAYDECPDCKEREAQQAQAPPQQQAPPPPPQYQPPPQQQYAPPPQAAPPSPQYQPPQYQPQYQPPVHQPQGPYQPQYPPPQQQYAPPPQVYVRPYEAPPPAPRSGLPAWVLTILFALAVLGVVAGVVWTISYFHNRPETKPSAAVESPAAKPGAPTNPIQKYIEISGLRFAEDPKHKEKTLVRFMLTNHSDAEILGLAGNVTVWGATRKSEEDAEGTFTFATDVKPMDSKEITAPLNTKLKIYELPDWQNVTTDLQITAPK